MIYRSIIALQWKYCFGFYSLGFGTDIIEPNSLVKLIDVRKLLFAIIFPWLYQIPLKSLFK